MESSSSSSKVTVEYFDPSSVYPLISSSLLARLPLRNLHWKSTTRPLRSIASLHVELIPHERPALPPPSQSTPDVSNTAESRESTASQDDGAAAAARPRPGGRSSTEPQHLANVTSIPIQAPPKERRHQIPGLRQTPYLKLYLLRCDDNDSYKTNARRQVREWIKTHTTPSNPSSSVTAQENHDAFEWLIVHVVLPSAFTSAHTSVTGGPGSGVIERRSSTRWPGRGASTVLEKVKADFNGSSKSGLDRVAQIRLHQTDIPPHLLPDSISSTDTQSDEAQQDPETAWSDFVSKLRSLILTSFDRRVGQYEEDIRQRDAQRHLPGWNFCTFFILKEGLARGFESVGLLEDALVGYDELAVGLDAIVPDIVSPEGEIRGSIFNPYTQELRQQAQTAWASMKRRASRDDSGDDELDAGWDKEVDNMIPLDDNRKKYRDLILSNNISLFDFRCYLFARQMSLLLRQANASLSRAELRIRLNVDLEVLTEGTDLNTRPPSAGRIGVGDGSEDVLMLAELCKRAVQFIPGIARIMRADLWTAFKEVIDDEERQEVTQIVDHIVCSWISSSVRQILAETCTAALPIAPSTLLGTQASSAKMLAHGGMGSEPKSIMPEPKTMMHPARRGSLTPRQDGPLVPPSIPPRVSSAHRGETLASGVEELAFYRAELFLLQRNALKLLGASRGWSTDLGELYENELHPMENVSLDDDKPARTNRSNEETMANKTGGGKAGVDDPLLRGALESRDAFYRLYEVLSDRILRHFGVAAKAELMEATLADLAVLKYRQGDLATAAGYFSRLEPFYTERGWSVIGTSMLQIHAQCLKKLDRKADSIRVLLELLGRSVAAEKKAIARRRDGRSLPRRSQNAKGDLHEDDVVLADGYLLELQTYSKELPRNLTISLSKYFGDLNVDTYPEHYPDRDGFQLRVRITHLLPDDLAIDQVQVRLVAASGNYIQDIWLESVEASMLTRGVNSVWVGTHAVVPGSYIASQITIVAGKLHFTHDVLSNVDAPATPIASTTSRSAFSISTKKSSIITYFPRSSALSAKVESPRRHSLDESAVVDVTVSTGWNHVDQAELRIRAATAGLRLQTANLHESEGRVQITSRPRPGVLELGRLGAERTIRFKVPYAVEKDLPEISVKVEIEYTTSKGRFFYSSLSSIAVPLPLGVNVQDIFTTDALFSTFAISTASSVPIRLLKATLHARKPFDVQSPPPWSTPLLVFPQQPASLICKITRTATADRLSVPAARSSTRLALVIDYRCLDEEVATVVESVFRDALHDGPHEDLSCLLLPALRSRLRSQLMPADLERIGLLGEVPPGAFDSMRWDEPLKALPPDQARAVRGWLKKWHEQHLPIWLSSDAASTSNRTLTLPVEVPQVPVVHTVDLVLVDHEGKPLTSSPTATVGHLLAAELHLEHTRLWDAPGVSTSEAIDLVYEIQGDSETWLVGGRRRGHFRAKAKEQVRFPVMLLPLRPGHLLLPNVTVQAVGADDGTSEGSGTARVSSQLTQSTLPVDGSRIDPSIARTGASKTTSSIRSETHNRSQAQMVLVLPDIQSTTVRLDPQSSSTAGSKVTLVDTAGRVDGSKQDLPASSWLWSTGMMEEGSA
ncbi:MAG: hypothetical protein M1823_003743 [Watsoniomyces obsoletus]|nr:MAG: hypothetical protein M1823_003743 [Watsoniomyces obsoletus]